jgi:3-oxoacyl-[acyl-carrier protein] reductase
MIVKYPDLEGKIILVTGASRGIGKEIALQLSAQGAHVVFNYRGDEAKAQQLQAEIESKGGRATPIKFDVTDSVTMKSSIDQFIEKHGYIYGLVNNAGISKDQLLLRLKEEDVQATLDTNLKSAILLSAALTKNFLKVGAASVVNVSSVVGLMGNASQIAYSASKAGLIGVTKSFAKELAAKNVRCNAICPGFIETDMTNALSGAVKDNYINSIPLKRGGTTEDVANVVSFLLSQASSYITGEIIKIDGGLYI